MNQIFGLVATVVVIVQGIEGSRVVSDFLPKGKGDGCYESLDGPAKPNWIEKAHHACFNGNSIGDGFDWGWQVQCKKFEALVEGDKIEYHVSVASNLSFPVELFFHPPTNRGPEAIGVHTLSIEDGRVHWSCQNENPNFLDIVEIQFDRFDFHSDNFFSFIKVKVPGNTNAGCYLIASNSVEDTNIFHIQRLRGC